MAYDQQLSQDEVDALLQGVGGDSIYLAQVEAADPEGDPLKFLLKSGPPGMTIDAATGAVRWPVTSDRAGQGFDVLIAAQDSEGAETLISYQIKTRLESPQGIDRNAIATTPSK